MLKRFFVHAALISLLLPTCFADADTLEIPSCRGAGCSRTPLETPWPAALDKETFEVLMGNVLVRLPSPVRRVAANEGRLMVYSPGGSGFHVELVTYKELHELTPGVDLSDTTYSTAQVAQLVFQATPADAQPEHPSDLITWRQALFFKPHVFGEANPVLVSRKETMTVYYYQDPSSPDVHAYIFDDRTPDRFVRILGKGISFDLLKAVVGTLSSRI